jgi:hypothetical protein
MEHIAPLIVWEVSFQKILPGIRCLSTTFNNVFRPFMYRNCNILSFRRGIAFFETLITHEQSNLCRNVRTLRVGVDFDMEPEEERELAESQQLWTLMKALLPRMTRLHHLIIAFHDDDCSALDRWARDMVLPSSLSVVQFASLLMFSGPVEVS